MVPPFFVTEMNGYFFVYTIIIVKKICKKINFYNVVRVKFISEHTVEMNLN